MLKCRTQYADIEMRKMGNIHIGIAFSINGEIHEISNRSMNEDSLELQTAIFIIFSGSVMWGTGWETAILLISH